MKCTLKKLGIALFLIGPTLSFAEDLRVQHLSDSVKFKTTSISDDSEAGVASEFTHFHEYLLKSFPLVHRQLTIEKVGLSLLYKWTGKNDKQKKSILFCAHQDVVPVDPKDLSQWTHPPFSGKIDNQFIWGRGTLDDKVSLMGILEATEALLSQGFIPEQTIYFSFGEDEEIGGNKGAKRIAKILEDGGVSLEAVFDEGLVILNDAVQGVTKPVALVGVAEKGFATLQLSVKTPGGHSSMPPEESAIGILGAAVHALETHPFQKKINPILSEFLKTIAPAASALQKLAFRNLWALGPLVKSTLGKTAGGRAMLGTTTALTIFNSGIKANVVPNQADATVNFRISPDHSIEDVIKHTTDVINDSRVSIQLADDHHSNPSSISSTSSRAYQVLKKSILSTYPDTIVAPSLALVITDSRLFSKLTENTYRFIGIDLMQSDLSRIHGINERISIGSYLKAVSTYEKMLKQF